VYAICALELYSTIHAQPGDDGSARLSLLELGVYSIIMLELGIYSTIMKGQWRYRPSALPNSFSSSLTGTPEEVEQGDGGG
jgi:hypothetical protein